MNKEIIICLSHQITNHGNLSRDFKRRILKSIEISQSKNIQTIILTSGVRFKDQSLSDLAFDYLRKNEIISQLESKLNPEKTAITDVSFNKTVLRLEGEKVFILLSKFLVANLEKILETNFSVAQTIFIKIPILFIRNNTDKEETSLDLHLNRSHAKYVYDLLVDGSKNLNI